jgi:hypothetical protein
LKRLVTIRNFGTLLDLEVAYWPDRFFALTGQIEELSRLSAKALLDVAACYQQRGDWTDVPR